MSFGTKTPRYYEVKGKKLPSVTTILSVVDKPVLVPWACKVMHDHIVEYLDGKEAVMVDSLLPVLKAAKTAWRGVGKRAMEVGTQTHNAIEAWCKGKELPYLSEQAQNSFDAFLVWVEQHKMKPLAIEVSIATDLYAGRIDIVCELDDVVTLVDFKSSKAIYEEYRLQTAAYRKAYNIDAIGAPIERNAILRLDKETGMPEYVDVSDTYERDVEAFEHLARFYHLTMAA